MLDLSLWNFYDPVGNCSAATDGNNAVITVPAGSNHDLYDNAQNAPRILQPCSNNDFSLETKLVSAFNAGTQIAGLIVETDHLNFMRFDFFRSGSTTYVFCASFVNGMQNIRRIKSAVSVAFPLRMRVERVGDQWTLLSSADGLNWTTHVTFAYAMTVNQYGLFAGNSGSTPPAWSAQFDYFFVDSPRGGITGSMSAVDQDPGDSAAAAGSVKVSGSASMLYGTQQEEIDVGIIAGKVAVTGSAAIQEDVVRTFEVSGAVEINGALASEYTVADTFHAFGIVSASDGVVGAMAASYDGGPDTIEISGTVPAAGAMAVTGLPDTLDAAGAVPVAGILSAEFAGIDAAAIGGTVKIAGALHATGQADVFSANGAVVWPVRPGAMAADYALTDSSAITGDVAIAGSLSATGAEQGAFDAVGYVEWPGSHGVLNAHYALPDNVAIGGIVVVSGALAAAQDAVDTVEIAGSVPVFGTLSSEYAGEDVTTANGKVDIAGALDANQAGSDVFLGIGAVFWPARVGVMAAVETVSDTMAADGLVAISGQLNAIEPADTFQASGQTLIDGLLNAVESLTDRFRASGYKNTGWLAATIEIIPAISAKLAVNHV